MARTLGAKNKVPQAAKENIQAVFVKLGGTRAMAEWAAENKTEFYKIYAKMLPLAVTGADGGNLIVEVVKFADTPSS